jgi:HPt (histidine-containing phosphotransfer) domain-containing protein
MIDRKKFDDTFQYFDKEVILNIIDIFEKELPERFEKIQKNIREKDFNALAFNSHSLKSVAGTFMATEPSRLAKKMEELAIRGDEKGLSEVFENLKSATEELLRELTEIRREFLSKDPSPQNPE